MHAYYDFIYLSPHLDDAALSCGGQIYQQTSAGQRVLIVSLTAGDPPPAALSSYAQSLHDRWELISDAVAARRAEDRAACHILGADWLHWELPDCIYRFHPTTGVPFYVSDADIFGEVHPVEWALVTQLGAALRALPRHGQLVAPLTVGHHVDHLLTRQAAEQAVNPNQLCYYEDYPYAQQAGKLTRVIGDPPLGWQPEVIPLSAVALTVKIAAIAAFRSQFSTFFTDEDDLAAQVRGYASQVGGERVWRRR